MAGYTRQSADDIVDGLNVEAGPLNDEFNAVQTAFSSSAGHGHDGTSGSGAPILTTGPTRDVWTTASSLYPRLHNILSLGTNILRFKDAFIAGVVNTIGGVVFRSANVTRRDITLVNNDAGQLAVRNADGVDVFTITETGITSGSGANLTNLNASNLTTGTVPDARLATNVVRNTRTINTGLGLSGGGNLSADRSLSVDITGFPLTITPANPSNLRFLVQDTTSGQPSHSRITGSALLATISGVPTSRLIATGNGLLGGGDLSADRTLSVQAGTDIVVNGSGVNVGPGIVRTTTSVIAGNGLTGGGTLATSPTLTLGTPSTITTTTTNTSTASSHTHNLDLSGLSVIAGGGLSGGGTLTTSRTLSVDGTVVRTSGTQSIAGTKTFTNIPVVDGGAGTGGIIFRSSNGELALSELNNGDAYLINRNLVGTAQSILYLRANGNIEATTGQFAGSGSNLTNIPIVAGTTGTLSVARGGTGGTTAATARTGIGAAADAEVVKLAGAQNITGVKTFNVSPIAVNGAGLRGTTTAGDTPLIVTLDGTNRIIFGSYAVGSETYLISAGALRFRAGGSASDDLVVNTSGLTGIGTGLTALNASNLSTGTTPIARLPLATQAQAEAGTVNTVVMTPLRTEQAILSHIYTGSVQNNVDFPVGTTIAAWAPGSARNSTEAVRVDTSSGNNSNYSTTGTGPLLTGVWKQRGNIAGGDMALLQRVS